MAKREISLTKHYTELTIKQYERHRNPPVNPDTPKAVPAMLVTHVVLLVF
jgi:hypothetical protein